MIKNFYIFYYFIIFVFCNASLCAQLDQTYDDSYFAAVKNELQNEHAEKKDTWGNVANEPDNFQAKFMNMLFILALLIAFMILASWMLKRMMRARITQVNQASFIKVIETRQLSPKSTLYFIQIENEYLLLGESPTTLSHIASFPAEVPTTVPDFPRKSI